MANNIDITATMISPQKSIPDMSKRTPIKSVKFEGLATSPGLSDFAIYPWRWAESAQQIQLSPSSTCSSPGLDKDGLRRGRPRADVLANLMQEGASSCSSIRCNICHRVFPREKSLQAHMRTHTGERPYVCDYPNCGKAFVQSGQLKTHQRLHTGEKPFVCSIQGCESRFTHANRHCPDHPFARLKREFTEPSVSSSFGKNENENKDVNEWLMRYTEAQKERAPAVQKQKQIKRKLEKEEQQESLTERKKARQAAKRRLHEQREKWYGALALIQLSTASP
ncbi:zinc finger protein 367-like [Ptychodera flava]|uniref:zinc finger protein 367-like n=1 Tax=Ptychodera flava TaxID=63121 RepID=UPI00396A42C4